MTIVQRPTTAAEQALVAEGFTVIVGLDEVGRGACAGPLSVGVAAVPLEVPAPVGLRDSKQVAEHHREALFPLVAEWCTDWSVGHAGPDECDRWGMTVALRLAARRALAGLSCVPDVVLLDGGFDYLSEPEVGKGGGGDAGDEGRAPGPPVRTLVRGDASCTSIAAASIVAKVTRDRMMRDLSESFPAFDFDRNKGYPSPTHRMALAGGGLTSIHRRSWSYVADLPFR
ncbi:MAG: ribonuclease HII [Acidimicrobiales bacterium]